MSRVDLRFPMGNVVLTLTQARLQGGLATHQLRVAATVSASWLDDQTSEPLLLTGRVSSGHRLPHHVGNLVGDVLGLRRFAVSEDLCLPLSDEQVHALDKERDGGPLLLTLDVKGTLLAPPPGVFPIATSQTPVRVPESTWTQDLDQMGKVLALNIRVPSPLVDAGGAPPPAAGPDECAVASRAQAVARLRQARSELSDGRYESCAATCRLVLDSLNLLEPMPGTKTVFDKRAPERTQPERWAAIHYDLHSLLSGAHHDGPTTQGFSWTREDAETVLAIVSSLASRVVTR